MLLGAYIPVQKVYSPDGVLLDVFGVLIDQTPHPIKATQPGLPSHLNMYLGSDLRQSCQFLQQPLANAGHRTATAHQPHISEQHPPHFGRIVPEHQRHNIGQRHLVIARHIGLEVDLAGPDEFASEVQGEARVEVVPVSVHHPRWVDLA